MKRFFRMMMLIVAATMAFAACSQYEDENIAGPTVKVNVAMVLDATRSSFGTPNGTSYPTVWAGDEEMKYSLNFGAAKDVTPTFTDEQSATAELTLTDDNSGAYTIHVLSPVDAFVSVSADYKNWNVNVPATQTPSATSCDPAAQVLCGVSNTSDVLDGSYTISFHHALAYGKMTLKNLALNGAKISSVAITTDSDIAGRHYVYPLEKGKTTVNSGAKSITINTSTDEDIWFACAPVKFNSLKVTVTTDKGVFTKQISASKTFTAGKVAVFAIDMAGVVAEKPAEYQLLTDVADLNIGDQVIIANTENAAAMSSTQNGNNRSKDAVTIENGCIVAPGDGVEIFVVEEGTEANTYAFLATKTEGYIYAASSGSNYLKTEQTLSANSSFKITITDGVTSIVAQGTNTRNVMQYNPSSNGGLFACYGSASQKPVDIYYLPSGNAPATPKISASDIADVPAEGVQNATAEITKKNITGDVTVTKDGTVVTAASLSGNTLTYTVSANTGDAREGWIKLAATGAECTIKVSQLSANVEYYVKVNSIVSGTRVLIVHNDEKALTPITSNYGYPATTAVTVVDGKILATPDTQKLEFVFEQTDGGYHLYDYANHYYYYNSGTYKNVNRSTSVPTNGHWVPTYNGDGTFKIMYSSTNKWIQLDPSYGTFGVYDTATGTMPSIYQLNGEAGEGGETPAPVQLTMSDITCSAQTENSLTFSWEAVANATGYQVSTDGGSTYGATQTATTYTWTGLSASTTKTIYVKAIGNGSTYTDSAAKSASGTTSAAQGGSNEGGEGVSATDVINLAFTGASGTSYTDWSGKTGTSGAVYAGNSAGDKGSVQLRSKNSNSGIITTTSAGKVSKVKVTWHDDTAAGRTLNVYGSNSAYSAATDLYDNSKQGTLLGTIVKGTSTELAISGDYAYIGLRSKDGAMYLTEIQIVWGEGGNSGSDTPATPTQLATPSVTASASGNTVTVTWGAITGAKDYTVKCGSSTQTVTTTSASFSGLTYSTSYNVSVVANPSDANANTASEAGTATVTTGADPNAGGSGEKKTYTLTITKENFNSTSYSANNGEHTTTAKAADGSTMQVTWVSNQVMNQNSTMQWQKDKGYIYNSTDLGTVTDVTIDSTGGTFTTYKGSSAQPTSNGAGGYFQIKVGNATGKVNSITVTFEK